MKSVPLRNKDVQERLKDYTFEIGKKDFVEMIDDKIICMNKKPAFFYYEKRLVPTLYLLQEKEALMQNMSGTDQRIDVNSPLYSTVSLVMVGTTGQPYLRA